VCHWNLAQLGSAIHALTNDPEPLQAALDAYAESYHRRFREMTARRLGWVGFRDDADADLLNEMFTLLQRTEVDQVLFFRDLANVPTVESAGDDELLRPLAEVWYQPQHVDGELRDEVVGWLRAWAARVRSTGVSDAKRRETMNSLNPRFVLRNYLAAEVIEAAEAGDVTKIDEMLDVLRRPYDEQPGRERFAAKRPEWARTRVGCSMLSCSS
jgi:serine/tyrosine/threonine adenylyltransferase